EARGPAPDASAGLALAAGLAVVALGAPLAVEGHGEHAGERGLARAAWAAQQVPVGHAPAGDGALERVGHVRLHRHVGEGARAILASECEGHGSGGRAVAGLVRRAPRNDTRGGAARGPVATGT